MKKLTTVILLLASLFANSQIIKHQDWEFQGNVQFNGGVQVTTGAQSGYVLTSDSSGNATWQAAAGGGSLLSATVTLTPTDILNMYNFPVPLVPSPGTGKMLIVTNVTFYYSHNTLDYIGDVTPYVIYQKGGTTTGISSAANILSAGTSTIAERALNNTLAVYDDFALKVRTSITNPLGGNGSLTVTVFYYILTL